MYLQSKIKRTRLLPGSFKRGIIKRERFIRSLFFLKLNYF
nr:MAG TPA: hypothetical protein [Caudoviricetes sp.]